MFVFSPERRRRCSAVTADFVVRRLRALLRYLSIVRLLSVGPLGHLLSVPLFTALFALLPLVGDRRRGRIHQHIDLLGQSLGRPETSEIFAKI